MHAALLAAVQPDNTPHGYNLTFAFPMLMFIVIAGALFLRFRAPHRVPGHADLPSATHQPNGSAATATAVASAAPAETAELVVPPQAPPPAVEQDAPAPEPESSEGTA